MHLTSELYDIIAVELVLHLDLNSIILLFLHILSHVCNGNGRVAWIVSIAYVFAMCFRFT